jgi:hypothetical protein
VRIAESRNENITALIIDRAPGKEINPEKILHLFAQNGFQSYLIATKENLDAYTLLRKPDESTAAQAGGYKAR